MGSISDGRNTVSGNRSGDIKWEVPGVKTLQHLCVILEEDGDSDYLSISSMHNQKLRLTTKSINI